MSDIPDWLVDLAAQGSDDDQDAEERDDDVFDFASSESLIRARESGPASTTFDVAPAPVVPAPEPDVELMDALRSQVEVNTLEDAVESADSKRSISLRIPGLLPWQQFVLALLLLLDVMVIGLLFLVMLGRMSIG